MSATGETKSVDNGVDKNDEGCDKKERKVSESKSFDDGEGEDLDPRVKQELEELNAATDGINHLETELNETKALFNQSIEDATTQLKQLHQKLGKCVDKARPYYEALKGAKNARTQLHNVSLAYELAQTKHFNAKKEVLAAEKKVEESIDGKLDPVLQELLNKVTTDAMDAAIACADAEKEHNTVNADFNKKHDQLQRTYNKLKNDVGKSRPFFELKSDLSKKLEIQRQRLAKIQEGIQISKNAYSQTLRKLQLISDDIHNTRHLKQLGVTAASEETSPSMQPVNDSDVLPDVSVGDDDTRSILGSEIYDDMTMKPGLVSCSSLSDIDNSHNLKDDAIAEDDGSGLSGLVLQVGDAMKGMQTGGLTSPFECITSHSLEYSMPTNTQDCLDSNKVENVDSNK